MNPSDIFVDHLSKHWMNGQRQDIALHLSGWLLNLFSYEEAKEIVIAICNATGDEETESRLSTVKSTLENKSKNKSITGLPSLINIIGKGDAKILLRDLAKHGGSDLRKKINGYNCSIDNINQIQIERRLVSTLAKDFKEEPISWVVEDFIAKKVLTSLFGLSGQSKSQVASYIASCVSSGSNCFGKNVEMGYVFYFNSEDMIEAQLVPRLRANRGDLSKIRIYDHLMSDGSPFELLSNLEELEKDFKLYKPKLVIFDVIKSYLGIDNYDDAKKVRSVLEPLRNLCDKYQCAILMVDHANKDRKAAPMNRVIGSHAFSAMSKAQFAVGPLNGDPDSRMKGIALSKGNLFKEPPRFAFFIESDPKMPNATFLVPQEDVLDQIETDLLLCGKRDKKGLTQQEKCIDKIHTLLEGKDLTGKELKNLLLEECFSEGTIYKARPLSKARKYKKDGVTLWTLPPTIKL